MMQYKQQISWLNGAKFVAIMMVMLNHTVGILYTNPYIDVASHCSTSLFVILSGMTSYISGLHHPKSGWGGGIHSCRSIVSAYCIAVVVYVITITHEFDFLEYLRYLVNFNISGPHYFVLLYIQLMVVSGFLFNLLQKCPRTTKGYFFETLIMVSIIVLSIWTTNHTNIMNVYGGGGKLFGGTYLILFFFGMLVMKHRWLEEITLIKSAAAFIISGTIWFIVWRYACMNGCAKLDSYAPFGSGYNPPSITHMSFAVCMLFISFGVFTLLEQTKYMNKVSAFICGVGKHTLYIFLYHRLILDYFLLRYMADLRNKNICLARVLFFLFMIGGSVLIEKCTGYILKFVRWLFNNQKEDIIDSTGGEHGEIFRTTDA